MAYGDGYRVNVWGGGGTINQCAERFFAGQAAAPKHCGNVKVGSVRLPAPARRHTVGFWSYRQPVAYWMLDAKRPTIALDCRDFSPNTNGHLNAVERLAQKKKVRTVCTAFPFARTYGGAPRGVLSPRERWRAGYRSAGDSRKERQAEAARKREDAKPYEERDYERIYRLDAEAWEAKRARAKKLGDREAIRYAIAEAHATRMGRLDGKGKDWDPWTREFIP